MHMSFYSHILYKESTSKLVDPSILSAYNNNPLTYLVVIINRTLTYFMVIVRVHLHSLTYFW